MREYGDAIKDLAQANIFWRHAVQKLWRTRYGWVIFYDYDEIEYMTDCNLDIPEPPSPEYEMASETVVSGGQERYLPEEFASFCWATRAGASSSSSITATCCRLLSGAPSRPISAPARWTTSIPSAGVAPVPSLPGTKPPASKRGGFDDRRSAVPERGSWLAEATHRVCIG